MRRSSRFWMGESMPIVFKMTIDLLLVALVPLAIAVWLMTTQARDELERSAKQQVQLLAASTAGRLDQLIRDSQAAVRQVALDTDVIALAGLRSQTPDAPAQGLLDDVSARFQAVIATNTDFASIFVTDAQGIGLMSTNPLNIGMDLKFREYCLQALAGNDYISQMLIGKTSFEPGVYFSTPVRRSEQIVGAVVLKLDGTKVAEIVDQLQVGINGYAMLADSNGVAITHPDPAMMYRSFARLSPEQIARIDPQLQYSRDTIESLDMPELMTPLTNQNLGSDTVNFTTHVAGSPDEREHWVAGFSQMQTRDWRVVVVQPVAQFEAATEALVRQQILMACGVALLALGLAIWRARTIVRPVVELTGAAQKLSSGDFSTRAPVYANDEVGKLATTFNEMVPKLQESIQLQRSVELATRIQQNLLPHDPPKLSGLDVAGSSNYCDSTGGDYFDFADAVDLPNGLGLIAVGDVTGHGLGAALLMCTARAALRAGSQSPGHLGQLLNRVNHVLCDDNVQDLFMTMTLMVIDPAQGTIRYACAAHDPIICYRKSEDRFWELDQGFVALGVIRDSDYEQYTADGFEAGDVIFLGTDGIWEARNEQDEMFEKDRLRQVIRENALKPSDEIGKAVEAALADFLGPLRIQDDVTYVCVKIASASNQA